VSEFGPSSDQVWQAQEVCHSCPVQWTCLTWALRNEVNDGIWGGSTEAERRMMLGSAPRQRAAARTRAAAGVIVIVWLEAADPRGGNLAW
jgi:WhiB family redox-sensing transcriptional regulator